MDNDVSKIIIQDDQDIDTEPYNTADRLFELGDQLSVDIISKNIIDCFDNPVPYETTNYISKFKKTYNDLKNDEHFDDEDILNGFLQEIVQLVETNLNTKYFVSSGNKLDSPMTLSIDEYLDKIEAMYNFFVVRHYTNIRDYFKNKLLVNKIKYIEMYKNVIDEKNYDDLFLNQDKKKYKDIADAIIIHYINDIISDIRSEVTSGYALFTEIANLDLFEEYNFRINEMITNYGVDFSILDDQKAADAYLKILDNNEFFITLRNDLLSNFLIDAQINKKYLAE